MKVPASLTYSKVMALETELRAERYDWEQEWRQVSEYVTPGRGIYWHYARPRKRRLTSPRVINNIAEDSLYVLTSGMHGGLTSPGSVWFTLDWEDEDLNQVEPLAAWLQECTRRLHGALHNSNFYSVINGFYIEYAGFGTGCMYMGDDTDDLDRAFRFELLTAGEYSFSMGSYGRPLVFTRVIVKTERQLVDEFPDTVSDEVKKRVEKNISGVDEKYVLLVECVTKETYQDKPYTRVIYQTTGKTTGTPNQYADNQKPLAYDGFYEFPYPLARWSTIGSDDYGIGPGARSLPDVKRLQEMEKAGLMATHKTVDPPIIAPSRFKGKMNTLPGGTTYGISPNEVARELYQVRYNFEGTEMAIARVEERIRRNFFNDIFLTAARDPNASPLRTGQVQVQEQEKMLRVGPVIEKLQFEFFTAAIERGFNIMMRKGMMPELPPELADLAGEYNIQLVSPLASAQRMVELRGINSFMGFVGQAAQFKQDVLDNVNTDGATRTIADINGVRIGEVLNTEDQVAQIRANRQQQMREEQERQRAQEAQAAASQGNLQQAQAQKTQSEAGLNLLEGQQLVDEMGV